MPRLFAIAICRGIKPLPQNLSVIEHLTVFATGSKVGAAGPAARNFPDARASRRYHSIVSHHRTSVPSKVVVLSAAVLCEHTANPTAMLPVIVTLVVPTCVHVTPSADR
jgi:hypothetical protein